MKRISILILFLLLASCAAPTESALTETPEPTATAQATVTSTAVAVESLTFNLETGECMYYGGDAPIECDANSITFGADQSITMTLADGTVIETKDGKKWEVVVVEEEIVIPPYLLDIEIPFSAPESWESMPRVNMEDVLSGAFAAAMRKAYEDGKVPQFGPDVPPFSFSLIDPATNPTVKIDGFGAMYRSSTVGKDRQDYMTGMFIGVDEDGVDSKIFNVQYINTGSGAEILISSGGIDTWWAGNLNILGQMFNISQNKLKMVSPAYYASSEVCAKVASNPSKSPNVVASCVDYVEQYQARVQQLVEQWKKTGVFPRELSAIPLEMVPVNFTP
ncbi:MAG: hypothetical protein HFACDABA_00579 [Anaerolineales bacterium]|nr:hypothetical protein [Anaerolineales bacterium]